MALQNHNAAVAKLLSYRQIRSRLEKVRAQSRPKLPHSLVELHEFLLSYEPLKGFYQGIVKSYNSCGLIFSSKTMLNALGHALQLFIDGTFSVVPKVPKIMQLYSVHIRIMDVGIATVFVLTEKRTASLYKSIWKKLFEMLPTLRETITLVMSDYEKAAMKASRSSFPNVKIHGCWFHYCQALRRRWKKLGLATCPRDVLSMGMSLPLAPVSYFEPGLELLQQEADKVVNEFPAIQKFIKYLRRTWAPIADQVSVYNCPVRTNNVVESFHSTIKDKLGGVHPNLWIFLEKLKELIIDQEINLARLKEGHEVSRPRSEYFNNRDRIIMKMQEDLTCHRISLANFLDSCSKLQGNTFDHDDDSDSE